jgi:hypothetical protein
LRKKTKSPPKKKTRDKPYINFMMARMMYCDKASVGVHDIHLSGGCLLNLRRLSVPLVSRHGKERRDEIRRC